MEHFELIFHFDNEDNSLTRFNGLSIDALAKFLQHLKQSVASAGDAKLVLSEVRGNCYAPVVSTSSKTQYENIKTLHHEIAKGNTDGLNSAERTYYDILRSITKDNLILNVYDQDKSYYESIETLPQAVFYSSYLQTNAYKGKLTRIGSRNLKAKNTIFISSYPFEIEITDQQDQELNKHYKGSLIDFYITEKINKSSNKIEAAQLDDFEILESEAQIPFTNSIEKVREQYGQYFSKTLGKNNE